MGDHTLGARLHTHHFHSKILYKSLSDVIVHASLIPRLLRGRPLEPGNETKYMHVQCNKAIHVLCPTIPKRPLLTLHCRVFAAFDMEPKTTYSNDDYHHLDSTMYGLQKQPSEHCGSLGHTDQVHQYIRVG